MKVLSVSDQKFGEFSALRVIVEAMETDYIFKHIEFEIEFGYYYLPNECFWKHKVNYKYVFEVYHFNNNNTKVLVSSLESLINKEITGDKEQYNFLSCLKAICAYYYRAEIGTN
jgi:hypothetical protein